MASSCTSIPHTQSWTWSPKACHSSLPVLFFRKKSCENPVVQHSRYLQFLGTKTSLSSSSFSSQYYCIKYINIYFLVSFLRDFRSCTFGCMKTQSCTPFHKDPFTKASHMQSCVGSQHCNTLHSQNNIKKEISFTHIMKHVDYFLFVNLHKENA